MENYRLVLPGHLNHYGYQFGGVLLQWVDEFAWLGASLDHPCCNFVTVGMDRVEFKKSVKQGSVLRFEVRQETLGTSSAKYGVNVYNTNLGTGDEEKVFSTTVTFVCLNDRGEKTPIPRGEASGARKPCG